MARFSRQLFLLRALVVMGCISSMTPARSKAQILKPKQQQAQLAKFAELHPIDVHVHVFKSGPGFQKFLEDTNLTLLNILVVDDTLPFREKLQPQIEDAWKLVHGSHGHVLFATTFDPYTFNVPSFTADSVKQINRDFADGAVAVKIWKNVGMEIKDSKGGFIKPDNPKFGPIYQDIAQHDKTLIAHLAEPDLAWQQLDIKADPLSEYYIKNPQWHMYRKQGAPSKKEILAARDRVLEQNPDLRVVGAHLGSMEKDLESLGRVLDRYPNYAVDTAARMEYLMFGPHDQVRAFLMKYQDRVIYGTDLDIEPTADIQDAVREWGATYLNDWRFFGTDETFVVDGRKVTGLKLPDSVLRKIYRGNAQRWFKAF